jgi:hypothetical protein
MLAIISNGLDPEFLRIISEKPGYQEACKARSHKLHLISVI